MPLSACNSPAIIERFLIEWHCKSSVNSLLKIFGLCLAVKVWSNRFEPPVAVHLLLVDQALAGISGNK